LLEPCACKHSTPNHQVVTAMRFDAERRFVAIAIMLHAAKLHARCEGSGRKQQEIFESRRMQSTIMRPEERSSMHNCTKEEESMLIFSKRFPDAHRKELERFLKKSRGDVERAIGKYSRFVSWKEENVASMAHRVEKLPEFIWNCGEARDGSGFMFVQGAMYDPSRGTAQDYAVYTVKKMLEIDANSSLRLTVLIDVRAGHGWPNPPATSLLSYLRQVAPLLNDFFPGRLERMLIYPVPRTAAIVWEVVRYLLDSTTASKIRMISGRDREDSVPPCALKEFVEFARLPSIAQSRYHTCE